MLCLSWKAHGPARYFFLKNQVQFTILKNSVGYKLKLGVFICIAGRQVSAEQFPSELIFLKNHVYYKKGKCVCSIALFIDVKEIFFTLTCCQIECLWRMVAGYITSVCQKCTASGQLGQKPGEGHSARNKCPFSILPLQQKITLGPEKWKNTD